jgi:hypothetical protein
MTAGANKSEDYRGFTIFWQEPPLTSAKWTANVTSNSVQLLGLMCAGGSVVIDGRHRDDMIANSKIYIDSLLNQPGAA